MQSFFFFMNLYLIRKKVNINVSLNISKYETPSFFLKRSILFKIF